MNCVSNLKSNLFNFAKGEARFWKKCNAIFSNARCVILLMSAMCECDACMMRFLFGLLALATVFIQVPKFLLLHPLLFLFVFVLMSWQNHLAMARHQRDEEERYISRQKKPSPVSPGLAGTGQAPSDERTAGQDVFTRLYAEFCDRLEIEYEEKQAREEQAQQARMARRMAHVQKRDAANAAAALVHGKRLGESSLSTGARTVPDVTSSLYLDAEDRRKRREMVVQQRCGLLIDSLFVCFLFFFCVCLFRLSCCLLFICSCLVVFAFLFPTL